MGKKKEIFDPSEDYSSKKTKKNKHKKAKPAPKQPDPDTSSDMVDMEDDMASDNYSPMPMSSAEKTKLQQDQKALKGKKKVAGGRSKGKDSGTSSEEERWLDAIESGKLEEVDDELKKIKPKDPKLMTARQRAMYERNANDMNHNSNSNHGCALGTNTFIDGLAANISSSGELLLALPTTSIKKEKILTEEAIEKAKLKTQKRKQLADEKREKDKKKTMERLLKKQDSKIIKNVKNRPVKATQPMISYQNTKNGATLSFPINCECPIVKKLPIDPPKPTLCAIPNCGNIKRYNCSKTNLPLCSYLCYKKNVASIKNIIC